MRKGCDSQEVTRAVAATHCAQADAGVMSVQLLQVNIDGAAGQEQSSALRRLAQAAEHEEEEAGGGQGLHR